jgi:hypothetical protein
VSKNQSNEKLVNPKTFEDPLCAQVGYQFFYIDDEDDDTIPNAAKNVSYKTALQICNMCSHIVECAEWGIRNETWGVWGGLTPPTRVEIRKRRGITLWDRV